MTQSNADREIIVSRLIDAPRELVFEAFTEQQHVEGWWVTNGTTHEWDPRPGGSWRYSMPVQDGQEYPFKIDFIEISKPDRFVYDYGTDMEGAPEPVRTTVTFDEQDGKTHVTLQLVFPSAAAREEAAAYGAENGAKHALKSLDQYLASR